MLLGCVSLCILVHLCLFMCYYTMDIRIRIGFSVCKHIFNITHSKFKNKTEQVKESYKNT